MVGAVVQSGVPTPVSIPLIVSIPGPIAANWFLLNDAGNTLLRGPFPYPGPATDGSGWEIEGGDPANPIVTAPASAAPFGTGFHDYQIEVQTFAATSGDH